MRVCDLPPDTRLRRIGWTVSETGCWVWNGARHHGSYGVIVVQGKRWSVHRLSYQTWVGVIPDGLLIRHKCDNPPCMNPDHLETGTDADNVADRTDRGRYVKGRIYYGEDHPMAVLSNQDAEDIRKEYGQGVLTQRALAEVYGVTQGHISVVVNNKKHRGGNA